MQLPRFLHSRSRWDRGACLRSSRGHGGPYATGGRHREVPLGTRKGYAGKPRLQGGGMRGSAGPCPWLLGPSPVRQGRPSRGRHPTAGRHLPPRCRGLRPADPQSDPRVSCPGAWATATAPGTRVEGEGRSPRPRPHVAFLPSALGVSRPRHSTARRVTAPGSRDVPAAGQAAAAQT